MKIANRYFKPLSLLTVLALMVVSCVEFEEFESTTYGPAPTITLAQVTVQDSSFTVSVTSSDAGYASVILLPGTGNNVPEDPEDLLTGNVSAMDYQTKAVAANTATQFTFHGLVQYAVYEVMASANNADGKASDIATLTVGTDDTHAPTLTGTSPGVGYSPVLAVGGPVTLVFDEPVQYDDTKELVFTEFYDGQDVVAASVEVDFNVVTVTPGEDFTNLDYAMLSYPEGAFTDYSGNLVAEMESYFDGVSALVGLYWGVESREFEAVSVTPEEAAVPADFEIVVTFEQAVDASDLADGDITLTYTSGLDVLTKAVLVSDVSASGNELTISQSMVPDPGVTVTLNIPAGVLYIGYGNPNAEVEGSWDILHPLQPWIGSYTVNAASYGNPGNWDEVWTVTTASVPGNLNSLALTIDAGGGGGVPFIAAIDDVGMTITISAGTPVGNLYGYGPTAMYLGDYANLDEFADMVGTIDPDGSIAIDQITMILTDYGLVDGLWDAFNTTWVKDAKKAAAGGNGYDLKAARFR